MVAKFLAHVRAQWMGALALFLVIAGGTAYAANTIGSSDIIDESIQSVDIKNAQVRTADVANQNLTGLDVKDQSGVDTCTHGTTRYGELCVRGTTTVTTANSAILACGNLGLRVPTLAEAVSLAITYDVPGVADGEFFWSDELDGTGSAGNTPDAAYRVGESGGFGPSNSGAVVVCVTTPTN